MSLQEQLKPEDIRYLSFEGGGGKGAAYLGVLIALLCPDFHVFKKGKHDLTYLNEDTILGIAGSSAGAMTAALLGSGVPLEELIGMMLDYMPSKDSGIPEYQNKPVLEAFMDLDIKSSTAIIPNPFAQDGYDIRFSSLTTEIAQVALDVALEALPFGLARDIRFYFEHILKEKTNLLPRDILAAADRIFIDDGLIPGVVMYRHLAFLINMYNPKEADKDEPPIQQASSPNNILVPDALMQSTSIPVRPRRFRPPGLTFQEAREKFKGREIVITGTNLSRGQLTYFSNSITPHLSIVAAARMSSSLPVLFKPIKIERDMLVSDNYFNPDEQKILVGTWVDGGVINNHPLHAFDLVNANDIYQLTDKFKKGVFNPALLPIVLTEGEDIFNQEPKKDDTEVLHGVFSQLGKVMEIMTENSTEAQYRNQIERDRTLKVPTKVGKYELETAVFNPNRQTVLMISNEAIKATLKYFNLDESKHPLENIDALSVGDKMKNILRYAKKLLDNMPKG